MNCIIHIDMDCFYAQVEAVRLGIDCRSEPYILAQWGNLIAVNYPARRCGIVRFDTVEEAREKCPHVKVSHVATYAVGETVYKYHANPRKGTHKVALEPYREASRKIFDILSGFEGVNVEKGSVDEAYLDVTEAARHELKAIELLHKERSYSMLDVVDPSTNIIPDHQAEIDLWYQDQGKSFSDVFDKSLHPPSTEENLCLLAAASRVVSRMRQQIHDELGYDCSAGIAHNKVLAKCISARHKPNQQTLLLPDRVASCSWSMPYKNFRGFGGKYGEMVRQVCGGAELCRDAWLVSKEVLVAGLGDGDGVYVYRRLRGYDEWTVLQRSISKTLMASKAFSPPATTVEGVRKWVTVLSGELCTRYKEFCDTCGVKGHTINVKLGSNGLSQIGGVANKTLPLPELVTIESLISIVMRYVAVAMSTKTGVAVNAVTITIGSLKKHEGVEASRRVLQSELTNFFSAKRQSAKRSREELSVVTISSDDETDNSLNEEKDGDKDVLVID